ncbi:RNA polymerase II C-terminal domain kinase beta subunit, partial [Coemansia sp. RSA 2705]
MASSSRRTYMTRSAIETRLNSHGPPSELVDHPSMVSATKSCIIVKQVGRSLGFPARTIGTAQLLVHRAHIFRYPNAPPIASTDLASACLLVAAKMEETIKRLRDILAHSYLLLTRPGDAFEPQSVGSAVTDKMRPAVMSAEQFVLDAIGFDFRTTHPHMLFVKLARLANADQACARRGWLLLADAFFTTLPVQYPAAVLAAGSLFLAHSLACDDPEKTHPWVLRVLSVQPPAREHNGKLENGHVHGKRKRRPETLDMDSEWWVEFDVSTEDIQGFVRQIVDFYLLFFSSSSVASPEFIERHQSGLPSRE